MLKVLPVHDMKTYRGMQGELHPLLISEVDGGEWSKSHPDRFTSQKNPVSTE